LCPSRPSAPEFGCGWFAQTYRRKRMPHLKDIKIEQTRVMSQHVMTEAADAVATLTRRRAEKVTRLPAQRTASDSMV
jgi:hypothetical protein